MRVIIILGKLDLIAREAINGAVSQATAA